MSNDLETLLDEMLGIVWISKRDNFESSMTDCLNYIQHMCLANITTDTLRVCTMTIHVTSSLTSVDIAHAKNTLGASNVSSLLSKEVTINDTNSFYNSITLKMKEGKKNFAVKLFRNGSFHLTGFVSMTDALGVVEKVLSVLDSEATITDFNVQMINTCVKVHGALDLTVLQRVLKDTPHNAYYDKERHPGLKLVVQVLGRSITCIIFRTGSMILTGIKDPSELRVVYSIIMDILDHHHTDVYNANPQEPPLKKTRRAFKSFDYSKFV